MSNAWTDRKQRCIINFLLNSQAGTMFLKSIDGSDFVKTGEKLFELLDAIVEEVGEENYLKLVEKSYKQEEIVLRLMGDERKPAMGYIYEAMDKTKATIIKSFNNNESKPLHAAAHFLNPEFFYDNIDLEFDFEVTNGLFDCIKKLVLQFDVQQKILTELHLYKFGAEHFGSEFAMQKYNAREEIDPISRNDIDVCNEWLVGEMDEDDDNDVGNDLVFEDDDALNWTTVYEASGVGERRMYTRRKKRERKQPTSAGITPTAAAAHTSKKQAMIVGSSSRKQKAVQENDEDLEFEDIELESEEEEEIMINFEASDGEEGEGDAPLSYDNNEEDYVGIGDD
uniref:DUF659 domain-containing protein n=1 Tax=Glycine max TaxID=3847 RepID=A0A0R0IFE9_SOYBN